MSDETPRIEVTRRHLDSHAPNYPEREVCAQNLFSEMYPTKSWRLASEDKRMTMRAFADAVIARDDLEALIAHAEGIEPTTDDEPPARPSVWDRLKGER